MALTSADVVFDLRENGAADPLHKTRKEHYSPSAFAIEKAGALKEKKSGENVASLT